MGLIEELLLEEHCKRILVENNIQFDFNEIKIIDSYVERKEKFIRQYVLKSIYLSILLSVLTLFVVIITFIKSNNGIIPTGTNKIISLVSYFMWSLIYLGILFGRETKSIIERLFFNELELFKVRNIDSILSAKYILCSLGLLGILVVLPYDILFLLEIFKRYWIVFFYVGLLISLLWGYLFALGIKKNKYNYYIESNLGVVMNIAKIIERLNIYNKSKKNEDINKKDIVYRIEYTAKLIKKSNNYLVKNDIKMFKASQYFENYKYWIYYPKNKSLLNLQIEMVKILKKLVDGEIYFLINNSRKIIIKKRWYEIFFSSKTIILIAKKMMKILIDKTPILIIILAIFGSLFPKFNSQIKEIISFLK